MCMKNEDEYSGCADWLMIDNYIYGANIFTIIESILGANIVDIKEASIEFTALLDAWHNSGIMSPNAEKFRKEV